jgi:HTH-type transcriptional regulator/antitoxin HigA
VREWRPAEVFHPGEFLRDELEARGWSQVEFAEIIERPYQLVNEIIAGKKGVTPETAKALGAALGTSAELWMNLDSAYKLRHAEEVSPSIAHRARLSSRYPVREMLRRAWIELSEDTQVLESRLLRYFEVASLEEQPRLMYAPMRSGVSEEPSPTQVAWVYRVKHITESMQVAEYSKRSLKSGLAQLKGFMEAPEEIRHIPQLLTRCGVRFVIVEPLPSSKIDGVTFWLGANSPVIGMSLRYDRIDNFWYVLRHEIEHVLNEDGKDAAVVDSELEYGPMEAQKLSPQEQLAHSAAAEFCVPQKTLDSFIARVAPLFSRTRVLAFAKKLGVHPGIVVGQLQRRLNRFDLFRPMLVPVRSIITPVALTDGYGYVLPLEI